MAVATAAVVAFVATTSGSRNQPRGARRSSRDSSPTRYERQCAGGLALDYPILDGLPGSARRARLRRHSPSTLPAVRAMVALAACFAVWASTSTRVDISQHWSVPGPALHERYSPSARPARARPPPGEDARYRYEPMASPDERSKNHTGAAPRCLTAATSSATATPEPHAPVSVQRLRRAGVHRDRALAPRRAPSATSRHRRRGPREVTPSGSRTSSSSSRPPVGNRRPAAPGHRTRSAVP